MIITNEMLWYVGKTHSMQQYNDTDTYTLFNYNGDVIATYHHNEIMEKLAREHNGIILDIGKK